MPAHEHYWDFEEENWFCDKTKKQKYMPSQDDDSIEFCPFCGESFTCAHEHWVKSCVFHDSSLNIDTTDELEIKVCLDCGRKL